MAVAVAPAGCGGENDDPGDPMQRPVADDRRGQASRPELKPPRCPPDASNCAEATGRVLTLEAVDPDGDGDAHFVLLSAQGITAPGITVIDVARELRPHPLPQPGDEVAASGPVYRGSYGQRQIQATALRVRRADH